MLNNFTKKNKHNSKVFNIICQNLKASIIHFEKSAQGNAIIKEES